LGWERTRIGRQNAKPVDKIANHQKGRAKEKTIIITIKEVGEEKAGGNHKKQQRN